MRILLLILISINISFFSMKAQSFNAIEGDTINYIDANNNKQGFWKNTEKRTEGNYINNEKEGIWKSFYKSGGLKSEISYLHGEKKGYAKIYYENGQIAEEGMWMGDKWTGRYKSYYANGKLSYLWNYNDKGNRSGYQRYFYENGNIKIEGQWLEGKEDGLIKEYYVSGVLKSKKTYCDGKCKKNSIKIFSEKDSVLNTDILVTEKIDTVTVVEKADVYFEKKDSLHLFTGNGQHVLYNKFRKTERKGEFVNGVLKNGKHYIYNEKGVLIKTEIYKQGKKIEVIIND